MEENAPYPPQRVHLLVRGRVQGVGFRAFAQRAASSHNLTGWARNLGWNQVEITAEGPREQLEAFIEIIRRGPSVSRVDECQVEWQPASGEFHSFEIRSSR